MPHTFLASLASNTVMKSASFRTTNPPVLALPPPESLLPASLPRPLLLLALLLPVPPPMPLRPLLPLLPLLAVEDSVVLLPLRLARASNHCLRETFGNEMAIYPPYTHFCVLALLAPANWLRLLPPSDHMPHFIQKIIRVLGTLFAGSYLDGVVVERSREPKPTMSSSPSGE